MNPSTAKKNQGKTILRTLLMGLALLLPVAILAQAPQWWTDRNVTNGNSANDYAAANQGQVKNIAIKAVAELDANLPGGSGDILHTLATNLSGTTANTNDYAAVNLGQLKTLSKPFLDRLLWVGYQGHPLESGTYPWVGSETAANDYAMANIGQVKNLFSFDLSSFDSDLNGLPDWWERFYFGATGQDPNAVAPRGDGLTILQAYQQGLNPNDYYNGQAPIITVVSGNGQTGAPGGYVTLPLVVSVTGSNGSALSNAPVLFTVTAGGGGLQASSSATNSTTLAALTDSSGQAKAYFKLPSTTNTTCTITCAARSTVASNTVTFAESTDGGTGTYRSPFDASDVSATVNSDGSIDVTWTNNTDAADQTPITIKYKDADGNWVVLGTAEPGATSLHIPAQ